MHRIPFIAALAIPLTAACVPPQQVEAVPPVYELAETSSITGTVTYRERIALLPGSILTVQLLDVARADAPAVVLNEKRYDMTDHGVPAGFTLELPNRELNPAMRLIVRATIHSADGRLMFTTDTAHPVMTRPVDQELGMLVMRKV